MGLLREQLSLARREDDRKEAADRLLETGDRARIVAERDRVLVPRNVWHREGHVELE
jgi:hypothetical protein